MALQFKPVPLQQKWTNPSGKMDLRAIYRRPRRRIGEFDETIQEVDANGLPLWDLTTPLPVRRHTDWLSKGFEYVTLADKDSLEMAGPDLAQCDPPLNWRDYICHPHLGPWNPKLYAAVAGEHDQAKHAQLLALLDQFGVEAVEKIRGQQIPPAIIEAWQARKGGQGVGSSGTSADTSTGSGDAAKPPARTKPPAGNKGGKKAAAPETSA